MQVDRIFFDMDGVLADFHRGVVEICGLEPVDQGVTGKREEKMWNAIRDAGHFYDRLELMPGAKEMFDAVYARYGEKCEILTGIPKPKRGIVGAAEDKVSWVRRLLSEDVKVNLVLREHKPQFCTGPGCILIDDYKKNIKEWEAGGGTGILSVNADETMEKLVEMGIL